MCEVGVSLEAMTWLYLFALLPAGIAQACGWTTSRTCSSFVLTVYITTDVYIIFKRFIFVISGEWGLEQELALERQRRSMGQMPDRLRRTTITQTTGAGRRREKVELWFTMETPGIDADDSFLPSMIISPMDFAIPPPRTPESTASLRQPSFFPRLGKKYSKSSLPPLPPEAIALTRKENGTSDRSAKLDMDFSDPTSIPRPDEWLPGQAEGGGTPSAGTPSAGTSRR